MFNKRIICLMFIFVLFAKSLVCMVYPKHEETSDVSKLAWVDESDDDEIPACPCYALKLYSVPQIKSCLKDLRRFELFTHLHFYFNSINDVLLKKEDVGDVINFISRLQEKGRLNTLVSVRFFFEDDGLLQFVKNLLKLSHERENKLFYNFKTYQIFPLLDNRYIFSDHIVHNSIVEYEFHSKKFLIKYNPGCLGDDFIDNCYDALFRYDMKDTADKSKNSCLIL